MKKGTVKKYRHFGLEADIARKLADAGINTPKQIRAMTDEGLLAVEGVGSGALAKIRKALGGR